MLTAGYAEKIIKILKLQIKSRLGALKSNRSRRSPAPITFHLQYRLLHLITEHTCYLRPVSYTHLDVYKRQDYGIARGRLPSEEGGKGIACDSGIREC